MRRNRHPDSRFLAACRRYRLAVTMDRSRPNDTLKPQATNRANRGSSVPDGWVSDYFDSSERRIHAGGCRVSTNDRARCESAGPTHTGAGSNRPRATRRSGFSPTFEVDFFLRFCVESCDFLRKAWPRHTAGPMRLGVLRARPETATSSGFAEALSEQFGPLPAISGTRPACVSLSGSP